MFDSTGWDESDASSTSRRAKAPSEIVRDDWEDDDEEEEDEQMPIEEKNKRIWDQANHKTSAPMPTFIVSSSTPGSVTSPPPAAAFQPALKILKRPAKNQSNTSPAPIALKESLEDREARYEAARKRIFGEIETSALKKDDVVRNPRGPDESTSAGAAPAKGFGRRTQPPQRSENR